MHLNVLQVSLFFYYLPATPITQHLPAFSIDVPTTSHICEAGRKRASRPHDNISAASDDGSLAGKIAAMERKLEGMEQLQDKFDKLEQLVHDIDNRLKEFEG